MIDIADGFYQKSKMARSNLSKVKDILLMLSEKSDDEGVNPPVGDLKNLKSKCLFDSNYHTLLEIFL
jgi:hypothetical protein